MKVTAIVSVTLIAADIQGAATGSLLALPLGRCLEQTRDKNPQLALIHPKHANPSYSPILIARKSVVGGTQILAWVVATTRYICPGVLCHSCSYLN